ncbi:hypothetical protein BJA5080_07266 [Bradyrhizobium diazoefficiens SEMIA 5080]|uniref:Uncharacterized protein n=1 Tax=Bradyrhizobium diazoefficiens SEMIA 5080 TaxID=754504 RepID=A0A837C5K7_9BRAD|nr:hypothetical protein BJA5080_07266 [Bradyrhizobium diazoefficiens SEMIA 5080]
MVIALGYRYCRNHAACARGQQAREACRSRHRHAFSAKRNGGMTHDLSAPSLRAQRSNQTVTAGIVLDCFAALAKTHMRQWLSVTRPLDRIEALRRWPRLS